MDAVAWGDGKGARRSVVDSNQGVFGDFRGSGDTFFDMKHYFGVRRLGADYTRHRKRRLVGSQWGIVLPLNPFACDLGSRRREGFPQPS
jgi:hypothetical protein